MTKEELKREAEIMCLEFYDEHKHRLPVWMPELLVNFALKVLAEHEVKQWHYPPELPDNSDHLKSYLVEFEGGFMNLQLRDVIEFALGKDGGIIRWRELPESYGKKAESGLNVKDLWNQNDIIIVAEKLYYEANPDTNMDVPSFAYEQVEAQNKKRVESKSNLTLYEWCKLKLTQKHEGGER